MRILFALPGLHAYDRGAEIAFIAAARALAKAGDEVTLIGSGAARAAEPYRFLHAGSIARERFARFPSLPVFRSDTSYEEATFAPALVRAYRPADYDVTLTCSYPFTNWILRRPAFGRRRPPHVFVTQNGDWPAVSNDAEFRFFGCEGLICTNPDFLARNSARWRCRLIPNGIDVARFSPGKAERARFGLPQGRLVVLMVSALIASKRVEDGIDAVRRVADAHLVVAGDGPLRAAVAAAAAAALPGRFTLLSVPAAEMPALYRSADVLLHMSREESFGNVYLEAMASGLPVVAHDSARTRWIVGEDEGLVDTADHAAVAAAVRAAAQEGGAGDGAARAATADEATAATAGVSARVSARVARAAQFSWDKVGALYRAFLQEVVGGG